MQNRLYIPREDIVLKVIEENRGVDKLASEWLELINNNLPKPKKFTSSSFVHVIRNMNCSGQVCMNKKRIKGFIYYEFER